MCHPATVAGASGRPGVQRHLGRPRAGVRHGHLTGAHTGTNGPAFLERAARGVDQQRHTPVVPQSTDRLVVLEQAHHLSDLDQNVFEKLATSPGNGWRFIISHDREGRAGVGADGTVTLGPLARPELRMFLQQLFPRGSVSSPLLDFLHERSGGMARVARLYWEHLRDHGLLIEPGGKRGLWRLGDAAAADLPEELRAHYIQRIDHLPPTVGTLARALAVLGESAPEEALGHLCLGSMAHDDFRGGLAALKQTGLIDETPGPRGTSFAFADPLCRQAVYETLSYATRENWHRQAAQYWRNQGPVGAQIAGEHLFRARDSARSTTSGTGGTTRPAPVAAGPCAPPVALGAAGRRRALRS